MRRSTLRLAHIPLISSWLICAVLLLLAPSVAQAAPQPLDAFGGGDLGATASGIAVTPEGRTYVADTADHRVQAFTRLGATDSAFAGLGAGAARLNGPVGVAVDAAGVVHVSETQGDRVHRYAADGTPLGSTGGHGRAPGLLDDPAGVAVGADGSVLVVDAGNARVQAFGPDGSVAGGFGAGSLVDPWGIAVGPGGDVYVTDRGAGRVSRFAADGTPAGAFDGSDTAAGALQDPTGIAVDRDGTVHVADAGRDAVVTFAPGGTATAWGAFDDPAGLAVDCRGSVYVVDAGAAVVRRFGTPGAAPPPCVPAEPPPLAPGPQPRAADPAPVLGPVRVSAASTRPSAVLGVSFFAERVSGTVRFRRPGAARTEVLTTRLLLPVGTRFDTTVGRVRLIMATDSGSGTQVGEFWDGVFTVFQGRASALTDLVLAESGTAPLRRPARGKPARGKARAAAARRKSKLWGSGKGSFRTSGRNAAATVRGTQWLVEDGDEGTTVRVVTGVVSVRDEIAGRSVEVRAGGRYVARDACVSRRAFSIRLRVPVGVRVQRAIVRVNGRPARVLLRRGRFTSRVDFRGRAEGTQLVRITLVTTAGERISGTRRYRTCDDKRPAGAPPRI